MNYLKLRQTRITDTNIGIRGIGIIRQRHDTVGELLDAMRIDDTRLSEIVSELDGGKDYNSYYKFKRALINGFNGVGQATASDIICNIVSLAKMAGLEAVAILGAKTYNWRTDYHIVLGHDVPCVVAGKCCGMVWSAWNKGARPPVACPMCAARILNP